MSVRREPLSIEEKYDEVRQLITIGKEKGYLLYDEVNELLPSEITSSEELDDLFNTFGSAGIEVIDSDQKYLRDDKPIDLKGWRPENYGHEYYGPVTLTQALAMSLNTVSVRLTLEFGPTAVAKTAYRLGIASKLEPNPSLALGTSEVSVIELVSAYAPFANGGNAVVPHVVERIRTVDGKKTLYTNANTSFGRVVDARHVGMMNAMMRQTLLTGTAHSASLPSTQSTSGHSARAA